MKTLQTIVLLAFISFSCTKENDSTTETNPSTTSDPVTSFKYKFDGTLVEMNGSLAKNSREGSLIRKIQQTENQSSNDYLNNSNYIYKLIATKNYFFSDDGNTIIDIYLNSNALSASTYSKSNNGIYFVRTMYPVQAGAEQNWDFTLTISSISNGYATGVFSGKLYETYPLGISHIITEGEFKNVKILE